MRKFIIFLLFCHLLFFLPTFNSVFVAGDYGGSDFTDFFLPTKFALASKVLAKKIPLWVEKMGCGFPLFSEGQIAFFFPTTILYLFLPFPLSLNLNFILPLFFAGLFLYFFLLSTFNLRPISAFFAALAFSFSPPFILHLKHPSLTWVFSFFPLELAFLSLFLKNKKTFFLCLFSLTEGLKFLAGNPQVALLTSFSSYLFFLFFGFKGKGVGKKALIEKEHLKLFFSLSFLFSLFFLFGLLLGAVQLLPTFSLWQVSERRSFFPVEELQRFSLNFKSLITFFLPYALENPVHLSAYFERGKNPFFWETNLYCGLLPLFFGLSAFLLLRKKRIICFLLFLFLSSLLLSFGPNTPLGFIFRLPFFQGFRVPGRFTFFTCFSLITASSFFFEYLFFQKLRNFPKMFVCFLMLSSLLLLFLDYCWFWREYNSFVPLSLWQKLPFSVSYLLKLKDKGRIYSFAFPQAYNFIFVYNRGWGKNTKNFLSYQEMIPPNSNLYYNLPSTIAYAGMKIGDSLVFDQLLLNLASSFQNPFAQKAFLNLLKLSGTKYLLSPFSFQSPHLRHIFTSKSPYPELNFKLYKVEETLPRAFIVPKAKFLTSSLAIQNALIQPDFDPKNLVLIERPNIWGNSSSVFGSKAEIVQDEEERVVIKTTLTAKGFLVFTDTFFPNWKVRVDGKEGEILKANLKFRAVPLPSGEHLVEFFYDPRDLILGVKISCLSFLFLLFLLPKIRFDILIVGHKCPKEKNSKS